MNDVTIEIQPGSGRQIPDTDAVSGLISSGVASGSVVLGNVYKLTTLDDAIALGIDADYDSTNTVLVYEHIKEFFRMSGNKGPLYIQLVAKTVTPAQMCDPTLTTYSMKLLAFSQGTVNQLSVAYCPVAAVTDDTALLAAIPKAQLLVDKAMATHQPLHVLLEGVGYDVTDSFDLRSMNAPGVSVVVGQCNEVQQRAVIYAKSAAVGTALGTVALSKVSESIQWVQKFNLYGDNLSDFRISGILSTNLTDAQLAQAHGDGMIFFLSHANYSGIYFNDSHSGGDATTDFQFIEDKRTINKAARLVRRALLPRLGGPVNIDPASGQIASADIKFLESLGNRAIRPMFSAGDISGPDPDGSTPPFTIDPNQDILQTGELVCDLRVVRVGTARQIKVKIGFINPNS